MLRAVYLSILLVSLAGATDPAPAQSFPPPHPIPPVDIGEGGHTELHYIAELWCTFSTWTSLSHRTGVVSSSGSRSRTFVVRRYTADL